MKKKLIIIITFICIMLVLGGCSKSLVKTIVKTAESSRNEKNVEDEDAEGPGGQNKSNSEDEDLEKAGGSSEWDGHPVLGQEDIEGYEGFEYLYDEMLMTESTKNEETGKMENKKLTVYIPEDDYASVNREYAYTYSFGLYFTVDLDPYIQYDQEDYSVSENLKVHMEDEFDPFYTADYKNLVIGEVEKLGKNSARATAEYCKYNEYEDDYYVMTTTYYLTELDSGITVLVEVEIESDQVTPKTELLIEELEAFYQFDINWDADKAQKKREAYKENGEEAAMFSTGYLLFELPENWSEDSSYGDYSMNSYAPYGDAEFSGCVISFEREYLGNDDFKTEYLLEDRDYTYSYFKEMFGDTATNLEIIDYGKTCLGNAVLVSFDFVDESVPGKCEYYIITEQRYVYTIQALTSEGAIGDSFEVIRDILENGQVRH